MERITLEQAKEYIALKDNHSNKTVEAAEYFTLTPSLKRKGSVARDIRGHDF